MKPGMTPRSRSVLATAAALLPVLLLVLGAGPASAATQYLRDGAKQNAKNGWDLPKQGTCPSDPTAKTRPDCLARRFTYVCSNQAYLDQASCLAGGGTWDAATSGTICKSPNYSWATSNVCNDTTRTTSDACVSEGGVERFWNTTTSTCSFTMKGRTRNAVTCADLGGNWVTTGTCVGAWVMPLSDDAAYNWQNETRGLLTGARGSAAGPGDQCLRCHNASTEYNGPRVRDVEETLWMGHKNMSRPYTNKAWGGPESGFACSDTSYTTLETCIDAGFSWSPAASYHSDDAGNVFDWGAGTVGGTNVLKWIYADWLAPFPRAISTNGTANASYSCARCHTTGWTSDATLQTTKMPEALYPGITWDGVSTFGQVKLGGGVAGDTNIRAAWDEWGISCTRCHSSAGDNTAGTVPLASITGMSTHHNNLTVADSTGYCTDPRFTQKTLCESSAPPAPGMPAGKWITSCVDASGNYLAQTTSAACTTAGGTWVAPADAGTCRDASSNVIAGLCSKGTCSDLVSTSAAACREAGATWTPAATDSANCISSGGQWANATDINSCMGAGGRWSGSMQLRGQVITSLCMQCHRQEGTGLPYTNGTCSNATYLNPGTCVANGATWTESGNGVPVMVQNYHETVTFPSHPHGNQFLNSPHAKFSGKFTDIATAGFKPDMSGLYKSWFMADGEAKNTGNGCTGCHDPHRSVVTDPEPFHEVCTECHAGPYEKNLDTINHSKGVGTPMEKMATEPWEACITCHMPGGQHLFRINPNASYSTFDVATALANPTKQFPANTAANSDGTEPNAVWVDLDAACGQCHGGGSNFAQTTGTMGAGSTTLVVTSTTGLALNQRVKIAGAGALVSWSGGNKVYGDLETYIKSISGNVVTLGGKATSAVTGAAVVQNPTKNNAPYYTKAGLAPVAAGMHDSSGQTYGVTFTVVKSGLSVTPTAAVDCGSRTCPTFTYDWTWGDGTKSLGVTTPTPAAPHVYASAGTYVITLDIRLASNSLKAGTVSRSVSLTAPDLPPTASGTFTFNANTWVATLVDTSTDDKAVTNVLVDWGDGTAKSACAPLGTVTHTYAKAGVFTVVQTAYDSKPQSASTTYAAAPATFTIGGTVTSKTGTLLPSAAVKLTRGASFSKTVYTNTSGAFSVTGLLPGTYNVTVTRIGYVFTNPAATVQIGPSNTTLVLAAVGP